MSDTSCPCGFKPESWMFCSAGTCEVCINSFEFINQLQSQKHTDQYIPCPTCGFHIIKVDLTPFKIEED